MTAIEASMVQYGAGQASMPARVLALLVLIPAQPAQDVPRVGKSVAAKNGH